MCQKYENWLTIDKVIAKIIRLTFLATLYLLPLKSLFDSHCLRYEHQRPLKMLKLYIVRRYVTLIGYMVSMMNDQFYCRPNNVLLEIRH